MAENVKNEESLADRLNNRLSSAHKPLVCGLVVLLVLVVALASCVLVLEHNTKKGLAQVDEIYFSLTSQLAKFETAAPAADSADDQAQEVNVEDLLLSNKESVTNLENLSLTALAAYSKKGGIVGVRANLLSAEIYFQQNEFEKARASWLAAAGAKKGAYTAPLAYFNAAVCSESLNDNASALSYYKLASEAKDFLLVDHALFSLGRVSEAQSDFASAKEAYEKLNDLHAGSSWANLAKSRLLALQAAGSIE